MDKNKNSTANEIALSALREDVLSLTFMPGASESPKFYIPYSNIKVHSGGVNAWKLVLTLYSSTAGMFKLPIASP